MGRFKEYERQQRAKWRAEHRGFIFFLRCLWCFGVASCLFAWVADYYVFIEDFPILVWGISIGVVSLIVSIILTFVYVK